MTYLLIPGRHLVTTSAQERYFKEILDRPLKELDIIGSRPPGEIDKTIFAVTSANQDNSRYNPISFAHRVIGIDRFWRELNKVFGTPYQLVGIPHYPQSKDFARTVIKEVEAQLHITLTPKNCVVLVSTPAVMKLYRKLRFPILPAEYDMKKKCYHSITPNEALSSFAASNDWQTSPEVRENLSLATLSLLRDFPEVARKIRRIWKDPLLTEQGSLTENRNYSSYAYDMSNTAIIKQKYEEIKPHIREGKIVDEGCADGALLVEIAQDFPDSDLIGIELTSEFTARCKERQRSGEFGGTYTHFHQRNLMNRIFEEASVDTTICNSTTHELWSYGKGHKSLINYLKMKYEQLRPKGRLIIRDVVGPQEKNKMVLMRLREDDGKNKVVKKVSKATLDTQSTYARFLQFVQDYRPGQARIKYTEANKNGNKYIKLRLKDAVEFMSKKDYTDNWASEMHEEFAFWNLEDWAKELGQIGFKVLVGPDKTHSYRNEWIVKNRLQGRVELFDTKLQALDYPDTNIIIVAQKPR